MTGISDGSRGNTIGVHILRRGVHWLSRTGGKLGHFSLCICHLSPGLYDLDPRGLGFDGHQNTGFEPAAF